MTATAQDIRNWTIYKITSPSGRIYIGKTINFKSRLRQYNSVFSTRVQPMLYKSFIKHGKDNHVFEIIDSFVGDNSYVNGKEIFWIRSYMSNISKYPNQKGLNLTDGGDGTLGYKKSESERKAMSARYRGRTASEHQKETASIFHKGNKWNLGRVQSEEEKEKRANRLRGQKRNEAQKEKCKELQREIKGSKVSVHDLETGETHSFRCLAEVSEYVNIHPDNISKRLNGGIKSKPLIKNRRYIFKYI